MRRSQRFPVWTAVVLVAFLAAACNGSQGGGPTPTPTPTAFPTDTAPSILTPTSAPSPTPTVTPTSIPTPEPSAFDFIYREFGPTSDAVWRVDPANPNDRQRLATIDHAAECSSFPSLSPDGGSIAYTVLPEGTCLPNVRAQAFVLPIGGLAQLVAERVDLQSTPLWSPDSKFIYLVRSGDSTVALIQVDIDKGQEETLFSADVLSLTPIGFSTDAQTLYYAQISREGSTSFAAYDTASGQTAVLLQASDGIARDYDLSPDGGSIAYIAGGRAFIADLASGAVQPIESALLTGTLQFQPTWGPDGSLALGQLPSGDQPSPALILDPATGQGSSLAPPDRGFDVPLSWAPDGKFLAVRSFEGTSQANPDLVLIAGDGQRLLVSENQDTVLVGWIKD